MKNTIVISPKIDSLVNITKKVHNSPTGVTFVSVKGYENKQNEISNQLINVGVSYENAKAKDVETLANLDVTTLDTDIDTKLLIEAKVALIKSLIAPDKARSEGQKNGYETLAKGIRVHKETRKLLVYGYIVSKDVIQKGTYKKVNSRPLTIAKNYLRKHYMKSAKFRQFYIEMSDSIK
jgi:hypothetical protein